MDNKDYKEIIQDLTNIYIGGRCTYKELMDRADVPFKLQAIISHYMLKEVDSDTTIENHIFHMDKGSISYLTYKRLRAKFALNIFYEDGHGKAKPGYHMDYFSIDELLENDDIRTNMDSIFLNDIRIRKINLMGVSI